MVELLPQIESEAKERMKAAGVRGNKNRVNGSGKSQSNGESAPIPAYVRGSAQARAGEAREVAAKLADVSPRTISNAKRIQKESPELFQEMRAGTKTVAATIASPTLPSPPNEHIRYSERAAREGEMSRARRGELIELAHQNSTGFGRKTKWSFIMEAISVVLAICQLIKHGVEAVSNIRKFSDFIVGALPNLNVVDAILLCFAVPCCSLLWGAWFMSVAGVLLLADASAKLCWTAGIIGLLLLGSTGVYVVCWIRALMIDNARMDLEIAATAQTFDSNETGYWS